MKKITFLLILITSVFAFGQKKFSIDKKYAFFTKQFDSLNNLKDKKALYMLDELKNSSDFKNNDTLKIIYYNLLGAFYVHNQNIEKTNLYCDECIKLAIKGKIYSQAAKCAHNKAVAYHFINKVDTAIVLEKKALNYAALGKDSLNYYISYVSIARKLTYKTKYSESNEMLIKALNKIKDKETKAVALLTLTGNYKELGDKRKLDKYYLQAIKDLKGARYKRLLNSALLEYSNYLLDNNEFLKTLKYADSVSFFSNTDYAKALSYYLKGRAYSGLKKYNDAKQNIDLAIGLDTKNYDAYNLLDDYKVRGKIYLALNKNDLALKDFEKSKNLFKDAEDKILEVEVLKYFILASLRNHDKKLGKDFEHYVELKDSIYNSEQNSNILKFETELRTKEKDSQLKTQQLEIQKQKTNRNIAFSGIGLLLLLSGGGFWFFKNRQKQNELKSQNTLLSLQQSLNAMELQSLNKQLDPHEIKNLLGSISPEIQEKAPDAYLKMLKLFNITKASLNNSSITDSVENQVRQIEDLLSLEKSMLAEPLEYSIENRIANQEQQIPRLMLKNLVENAIKHGIKGKDNGGKIQVILEEVGNFIEIQVDDTGKGRKQAISLDSGIGTSTYQNLFATLNQRNKENASFEIIDKEQGTKVEVKIPKDYQYS